MRGPEFGAAISTITNVSHHRIHAAKEIYADSNTVYIISDNLSGRYKNLTECVMVFNESDIAKIL